MSSDAQDATPDADRPDGRLLVQITTWEGNLHVGLSSELTPPEHRFQGGLDYVRSFEIEGCVVAPKRHRGKSIRLWLTPFGPDMRFGPGELEEVGQLRFRPRQSGKPDLSATLLVPEAALPTAATCLSTIWKYVHIWTFDERAEQASVSKFSFSSTIHGNLKEWIASD